jgi:hypothetical protein
LYPNQVILLADRVPAWARLDSASLQLWNDALCNQWVAQAIRDHGRGLPREAGQTLSAGYG